MPMKSEPFCIVIDAPAALSTNMEVYCPACLKENITIFIQCELPSATRFTSDMNQNQQIRMISEDYD